MEGEIYFSRPMNMYQHREGVNYGKKKLLKLSPERKVIAASEQSDRNPSNT